MNSLFLIRHAQASLGSDHYDRLTPHGLEQAQALGRALESSLATGKVRVTRLVCGTLDRHRQTIDAMRTHCPTLPAAEADARWNEYEPERVVGAWLALLRARGVEPPVLDADRATREGFSVLRAALRAWILGELPAAADTEDFPAFRRRVAGAFRDLIEEHGSAARVSDPGAGRRATLVIASAGSIALATSTHLEMPDQGFVQLNFALHHTALTEFAIVPHGVELQSFNIPLEACGTDLTRY